MTTKTILNQLSGKDLHKAYRIKVQQYSEELSSLWEDVKHGFVYGSQNSVADLKSRFLGDKKDAELPQHNRLLRAVAPHLLLKNTSDVLGFDIKSVLSAKRIAPGEKEKRDMLIYLLWTVGRLSNQQIGSLLGVTYSTVSKVVGVFRGRIQTATDLRAKFEMLKSQFKA